MKRSLVAVLIGALALAVFAIFSALRAPVTKTPALHPVAEGVDNLPNPFDARPCVFSDATYLSQALGESDLVVAGTVEGAPQVVYPVPGQLFTQYALRVRSVLHGPATSGVLTIQERGGEVRPALKPGPQIVFLHSDGPGSGTYTVTDGLNGIYLTRASGMTRECPHGPKPSVFVDSGTSEAAFSAEIQGLTPTHPPHR
jgi:hypothetical protein